jgi:hypothetical protein
MLAVGGRLSLARWGAELEVRISGKGKSEAKGVEGRAWLPWGEGMVKGRAAGSKLEHGVRVLLVGDYMVVVMWIWGGGWREEEKKRGKRCLKTGRTRN